MKQPRTATEMLEVLDDFFVSDKVGGLHKRNLWDCITVFRGDDRCEVKFTTVAPLRSIMLPRTSELAGAACSVIPATFRSPSELDRGAMSLSVHFDAHLGYAIEALENMGRLSKSEGVSFGL